MREPTYSAWGEYREDYLKELILYIAGKCREDQAFGATKLNKLLWWSDFSAFVELGRPITGVEYQALKNGPAPRRLLPIRKEMMDDGDIELEKRDFHGYTQVRVVALRPADKEFLLDEELEIVDKIIEENQGSTGSEVSEESHGIAWNIAKQSIDGLIPYEAAYLIDPSYVSSDDKKTTRQLAEKFGW